MHGEACGIAGPDEHIHFTLLAVAQDADGAVPLRIALQQLSAVPHRLAAMLVVQLMPLHPVAGTS